jgi:hypothetical protein
MARSWERLASPEPTATRTANVPPLAPASLNKFLLRQLFLEKARQPVMVWRAFFSLWITQFLSQFLSQIVLSDSLRTQPSSWNRHYGMRINEKKGLRSNIFSFWLSKSSYSAT